MKLKTILVASAVALFLTGPAMANSCPKKIADAKKMAVDMNVSADLLTKFNQKIAEAQADHDAGKHKESVAAVREALTIIGM